MKTQKSIMVLSIIALLSGVAHAMPEASTYLIMYSPTLPDYKYALVEQMMYFFEEPEETGGTTLEIKNEISELRNRTTLTQEQASKEIAKLIEDKKLPDYILDKDKGTYSYNGNINGVYLISECKLYSQPNTESQEALDAFGWDPDGEKSHTTAGAYDYLGEWTSPKGEQWVLINYLYYEEEDFDEESDEDVTVIKYAMFVGKQYTRLVTNEQLKNVADAIEFISIAAEISHNDKQNLIAQYQQQLQQAQRQVQQAQQQARQSRQSQSFSDWLGEYHTWYCNRCGKQVSGYNLPTSNNCLPRGAKRPGPHDWTKVK